MRINPDEIHISDPDFYAVLYTGGQERRDKVFKHTRQFGAPNSVLGAVHHDLHRMRRAILSPFFSKASVYRLEPVIQDKVDEMMERIEGFRLSKLPIPLFDMFAAYTNGKLIFFSGTTLHEGDLTDDELGQTLSWSTPLREATDAWHSLILIPSS